MGIIAKNIIVNGQEIKSPPKIEEPKTVHEEKIDNYHHEEHGDLHKLINKKSDYLADMMALKK